MLFGHDQGQSDSGMIQVGTAAKAVGRSPGHVRTGGRFLSKFEHVDPKLLAFQSRLPNLVQCFIKGFACAENFHAKKDVSCVRYCRAMKRKSDMIVDNAATENPSRTTIGLSTIWNAGCVKRSAKNIARKKNTSKNEYYYYRPSLRN